MITDSRGSASRPTLCAAVLETRNYVVGAANAASGLYRRQGTEWVHSGWSNLRCTALEVGSSALFLASGNGVVRSRDDGASWRVTTDWRICEVLDVALDPFAPGRVVAASAYGLWHSPDEGGTWEALPPAGSHRDATFTAALVLDAARLGRIVIGTEDGLFESLEGGQEWHPMGPRVAVRALAQSPISPERWLAGTAGHGVLLSTDDGATWSAHAGESTIYAVALDASDPTRMAAAGYGSDLWTSTDGGQHWRCQPLGIPTLALHALTFDLEGALWLGTVGEGVFVTNDLGETCHDAGLPETTIYDLEFA